MPLRPRRLFGGPSEALVLGDVQHDAYAFSALVGKVARFHLAIVTLCLNPRGSGECEPTSSEKLIPKKGQPHYVPGKVVKASCSIWRMK